MDLLFLFSVILLPFFIVFILTTLTTKQQQEVSNSSTQEPVDSPKEPELKRFQFPIQFENTKENQSWFHYIMKDACKDIPRKEQFQEMSHEEIITFVEIGEKVYQYWKDSVGGSSTVAQPDEHGFPTLNLYAELSNGDLHYIGTFPNLIFNNLKIMIMKILIIVLFTLKEENIRHLMLIKTEKLKYKL
ncbi:hypothetical protein [Granulicatella adiacens]|uniref:hypothetical protein n=1 Tax=Granulicatella adiacens TaxID=46124 RepID=UPI0021A285A0|nr:hypothetical protein [Granulicatella adiacens]MCT2160505.1 hypothetical protein [Granulicatella adiacens]